MKTRALSIVGSLILVSGPAWAGRTNYFETSVNPGSREAYGSLYDTRHSADNVQYIGCSINLIGGSARVTCEARDAASDSLVCSSADPEVVKIAQGLSDNGYVYFRCDAAYNLTYIYVATGSLWLP